MRFIFFLTAQFSLIIIVIYAMATHQTVGKICRDSGRSITNLAQSPIDSEAANWQATVSARQTLEKSGHAIKRACIGG